MAKVFLVSLGCDKNRVDSEYMLGALCSAGHKTAENAENADVIVVNTCGFIREAVEEGIETILDLAAYKENGNCKALLVTGCMAQRYRDEILKEIPEVDAILGVDSAGGIAAAVEKLTKEAFTDEEIAINEDIPVRQTVDGLIHVAYVKIAEGCDNHCAYCAIPSIRGGYRSRAFEDVLSECRGLIRRGARELVLVAQDTARYGADLYGRYCLHELIEAIADLDGLVWVRLMYAYPEHITPDLISVMTGHPKICRYLDVPIQHSHNAVLKRMGRKSNEESLRALIAGLRGAMPDIILRTTLMVGFPGETQEEFDALCAFVSDMRFDRLGVFAYSREDGTPAARMRPQVKASVKNERRDILMKLQQEIHREKQNQLCGTNLLVMVDTEQGRADSGGYGYAGRSYRDACEVDAGIVFTSPEAALRPGDMVSVSIISADEYDLYGVHTADESAQ